ncbi:rod shape-determining protein RodA [Candidatus Dojkabacteria bacterium]|nr:rod shape-determining protein RodA [Candidatus Dojkabacteria bacterium]
MKKDWLLFVDILLILALGLTTLYSTVIGEETILRGGGVINRQLLFILVGLTLYFVITYFNYKYTGHWQVIIPIYLILVIGLVLLLFFGVEINQAKRWIIIGGFQLQISEFTKIILIMITAFLLSLRKKYNIWLLASISIILSIIPAILVFLEPDAGTAVIMVGIPIVICLTYLPNQLRNLIFVALSLIAGVIFYMSLGANFSAATIVLGAILLVGSIALLIKSPKNILMIGLIILAGLFIGGLSKFAWTHVLGDYQKARITCFIDPEADPSGACFQVSQSKIAIGSGLLDGLGFGHGTQSKLRFLPEHQTDFIFAAFTEEFGFVGSILIFILYGFAILRIIMISTKTRDLYGSAISIGMALKILFEFLINVGMNLSIMPATGVPLPLMSAGGSMLLATMIGLGLVQSVLNNREIIDSDGIVS